MNLQTPNAAGQRLSVDDFERAVDLLELAHFDAVRAWWEEQQSGEQRSPYRVMIQCTENMGLSCQ